jgi:O-antigen/teichoic acid export membrane protein
MELLKRILTSSFWLLIGNSIGRLAMFLANIFAARILSQEAFGQFSMIRTTITSIEGLISGSLGSTIIKNISYTVHNKNEDLPKLLTTIFILNIVIGIFLIVILFLNTNFIINKFFLGNMNLVNGFYIGLFILTTTITSTLLKSILVGFEKFKVLSNLSIISSIISIPIIFFLIFFYNFNGALFGVALYFLIDSIIKYIYYKKLNNFHVFNFESILNESKRLLLFSGPIFISIIITSFSFWYARVLIIKETNAFKDIAIFDAAFQWLTVIMIITGATTSVALTMLSKVAKDNKKDSTKILILNLIVNFFIALFISIFFVIFSKQIMGLYGENYLVGMTTLKILSLVSIFFTLSSLLNKFILVNSNIYIIPISSLIASISLFSSLYYLNDFLASEKLSIAFLIFYFTNFIIYTIYLYFLKFKGNNND